MESTGNREETKETHRVTDRRRVGREGSPDAPQTGESSEATHSQATPGETAEGPTEETQPVSVTDLVRLFIAELHGRAWVHMGLIVDPATKQLAKDLSQAQLAIDCIASMIELLGPFTEKAERGHLEGLVADLRINYVRQSGAPS